MAVDHRVTFLGNPEVETRLVAAAVKPSVICKIDSSGKWEVAAAQADCKERLFILEANYVDGQTLETAFTANSTVRGRILKPLDRLNARMDAGTYTDGQALTISANGYLKAAATGNFIIAYVLEEGAQTIDSADAGKPIPVTIPHGIIAK